MRWINNSILSAVFVVLFISLIGNFIQYKYFRKEPVIETVVERDTIMEYDTLFVPQAGNINLDAPEPFFYDSISNIAEFRDTFLLQYGYVVTNEKVQGDLLSKGMEFKLDIPEYYRKRTITNTITHTVRNNLIAVQGGFLSDMTGRIDPMVGGTFIWNSHRNIVSLNIGLNQQFSLTTGFVLWR